MSTDLDVPVRAIALLAGRLRSAGVRVDHGRVSTAVQALATMGELTPVGTYWALRVTLCSSADDVLVFDRVLRDSANDAPAAPVVDGRAAGASAGSDGPDEDDREPAGELASERERLRSAAFDDLSAADRDAVNRLIAQLRPPPALRRSRRTRPGRGHRFDVSRTARSILRAGAEPTELIRRRRRTTARRRVILIDVSGSMTPYADPFLRFAHAAVQAAPTRTEVFTMGTRLTRVTSPLRSRDASVAIRTAGEAIPDWSGGTRIGESLRAFLDRWGQRGAARQATAVIVSDGWERGDPALLAEQLARLDRLAATVIWVSPHRGRPGYVPATAGLRAAAPYVDRLVAGHNVRALDDLAAAMADA